MSPLRSGRFGEPCLAIAPADQVDQNPVGFQRRAMENSETADKAAGGHLARLHQDAEQGSPLAQYLRGAFYQCGEAIPQDYAEAANWYGRAPRYSGNRLLT